MDNFFSNMTINKNAALVGIYDPALVALSLFMAFIACYTAFAIIERIHETRSPYKKCFWLLLGGAALGGGIFSMHFIGMEAYILPIPVVYDIATTLISFIPAFIAAVFTLFVICRDQATRRERMAAGIVLIIGVGAMHYLGMTAMRLDAKMMLEPFPIITFFIVAAAIAGIALNARPLQDALCANRVGLMRKTAYPLIMAVSISGMHYIPMTATYFIPMAGGAWPNDSVMNTETLSAFIAAIVFIVIMTALMAVYYDRRLHLNEEQGDNNAFLPNDEIRKTFFNLFLPAALATLLIALLAIYVHWFTTLSELKIKAKADIELASSQMIDPGKIHAALDKSDGVVFLLNKDGDYLADHHSSEGQALSLSQNHDFAHAYPEAWRAISSQEKGQLETPHGIFTFGALGANIDPSGNPPQEWKVVIRTQLPIWSLSDFKEHPILSVIFPSVLIVLVFIARSFAIATVTKQQAADKIEELLREVNFQKLALDKHALVSSTDVKGNINYVNDNFCAISGYSREELMGQNHRMLKSDEHSDEMFRDLWHTIANGKVWHGEIKNIKKDGGYYWVSATIVPFLDNKGKPFKYVSVRTDITSTKNLSIELANALVRADMANQAKSMFLANMSHEIRTPMNAIIGLTDLCLRTDLKPKQRDYLKKVYASSEALLGIINDILDFSKIEAGKLAIEAIPFYLDDVLDKLWTLISINAQQKDIELLFLRAPDVPNHLIGDPLRLGQVLTNLVSNALKFTPSGEIVICIKQLKRDKQTIALEFSVKDTGIGMTPEQQRGLFQSFSQVDASTTRKFGGTGLGLTICKQLVTLMRGEIRLESAAGKGSTFIFSAEFELSDDAAIASADLTPDLHDMHILVADDNATALNIFKAYLESFAFIPTLVNSGAAALAELKNAQQPFDLLLIDWNMPDMNGLETTINIMADEQIKAPPKIVLVSSADREELLSKPGAEYLSSFLPKPICPSLLLDTIMDAFGKHPKHDSAFHRHQRMDISALRPIQGARILLVEDNEVNQEVACTLLQQARFSVDIANNGQEALDKLECANYDCVLMDIQMPIMDGYEATRKIRQNSRFKSLPVLAMTANAMVGDKLEAEAAGMNDHISKPINSAQMFATLFKWIEHDERDLPEAVLLDAQDAEILPDLPGVDTEAGLSRMGGNVAAYRKMLEKFADNQAHTVEEIRAAFAEGDSQRAFRLAHTLKGVAGNVGITALQQTAHELETALKAKNARQVSDLLTVADNHIKQILSAIADAFPLQQQSILPGNAISPEDMLPRLIALRDLLEQYDATAEDALDALLAQTADPELKTTLLVLKKYLSQYNFEAASACIVPLVANLAA